MKEKKHKNNKPLDMEEAKVETDMRDGTEHTPDNNVSDETESDKATKLLAEKDKQIAELTDKWQRTFAEFDNFRKRTQKEKAAMYNDGVSDTISKLLPIIDNFERALASDSDKESSFFKGVDMIYKQLQGYFKETGVEEIPSDGESFDPNLHYAVTHIDDKNFGDNEVVETLCKGYKFKDKVIRPAMVKVAN